ncbi:hypothetical protein [Paracoccus sediminilitoris]|uniref:hypothetical protein n=1 Tax=Paracoccus sediminilitoris TaxID=2202419 RepID=UPI00272DA580|nr:hypothetical protein [Paracoccus sediminilitoris]
MQLLLPQQFLPEFHILSQFSTIVFKKPVSDLIGMTLSWGARAAEDGQSQGANLRMAASFQQLSAARIAKPDPGSSSAFQPKVADPISALTTQEEAWQHDPRRTT